MNQLQTSEKKNSTDHVYTYIHTYMEKRKRKENTKNTNVIFYDGKDLDDLQETCLRNNTNVSSVISNLIREFNLLSKQKNPQKTLFDISESENVMDFFHDVKTWDDFIRTADEKQKQRIKEQVILIDKKLTKYL